MKNRPIAHLSMAVLLLVSCYGLYACRAIKKDRHSSDSTNLTTGEQKQAWNNESMQEIIIETDDLASLQTSLSLPAVLGLTGVEPDPAIAATGYSFLDSVIGKKAPPKRRTSAKITIRSKAKAVGSSQSSSRHEQHQRTSARIGTKMPSTWSWAAILLIIGGVVAIAIIISTSKRS